MKIVYIAPMFHTNQVPIIKGWLEHGHEVAFICHYKGKTEDHSVYTPYVLGYSRIFLLLQMLYGKIHGASQKLSSHPEAFQDRFGIPPILKLHQYLKELKPDVVILRERSLYSIFSYMVCRSLKIKCILYNQTPLWDYDPPRNDFAHKIVKALTPRIRMTPVYGNPHTGYFDKNAVYIPFVIEPHCSPTQRKYFQNGKLNILCVGKFEERKHHLMLLEVLTHLIPQYSLHLTLVGEVSTQHHKNYYSRVQEYVTAHNLSDVVNLYTNCAPGDMSTFYSNADLFVLPSTGEFASVSQLEAMSYSLPVIVSDTNGTSCYIENGKNGYIFKDNDIIDLEEKITNIISNRDTLLQMGAYSFQLVLEKYNFPRYQSKIEQIIE